MVDRAILANKIASVRDAVARIREVLPPDPESFLDDRTLREVTILNLFVALQKCLSLAARLAAASGLRNLVAHRYGVLDWRRIHEIAATRLDDLLAFCDALALGSSG